MNLTKYKVTSFGTTIIIKVPIFKNSQKEDAYISECPQIHDFGTLSDLSHPKDRFQVFTILRF